MERWGFGLRGESGVGIVFPFEVFRWVAAGGGNALAGAWNRQGIGCAKLAKTLEESEAAIVRSFETGFAEMDLSQVLGDPFVSEAEAEVLV